MVHIIYEASVSLSSVDIDKVYIQVCKEIGDTPYVYFRFRIDDSANGFMITKKEWENIIDFVNENFKK